MSSLQDQSQQPACGSPLEAVHTSQQHFPRTILLTGWNLPRQWGRPVPQVLPEVQEAQARRVRLDLLEVRERQARRGQQVIPAQQEQRVPQEVPAQRVRQGLREAQEAQEAREALAQQVRRGLRAVQAVREARARQVRRALLVPPGLLAAAAVARSLLAQQPLYHQRLARFGGIPMMVNCTSGIMLGRKRHLERSDRPAPLGHPLLDRPGLPALAWSIAATGYPVPVTSPATMCSRLGQSPQLLCGYCKAPRPTSRRSFLKTI